MDRDKTLEDGWRENTCTGARVCEGDTCTGARVCERDSCSGGQNTHSHTHTCNRKQALSVSICKFSFRSLCLSLFPCIFFIFAHAHRNPQTHTRLLSLSFFEASPSLSFSRTSEKLPKLVHGRVRNCLWTCLYGEDWKRWEIKRLCEYTYM